MTRDKTIDRVTPLDDALRAGKREFNYKGLDFVITDFERGRVKNKVLVDVIVSNRGQVIFDDRVQMINPALWTPNPTVPSHLQRLSPNKFDDAHVGYVLDPLLAAKETLVQVISNVTKGFTVPRIERYGYSDKFRGDTLAVRGSTGDGNINSDGFDWTETRNGAGTLTVDTTQTAQLVQCSSVSGTHALVDLFCLVFDASSITDLATVTGFTITLTGSGEAKSNHDTITLEIRAYNWGTTLTTADWLDLTTASNWTGKTSLASMLLSAWNISAANAFTSVATYSWISLTTSTYIALLMDKSYSGSAPSSSGNEVYIATANFSGTSSDPLLDITYTNPAGGGFTVNAQRRTRRNWLLRR